VDIFGQPTGEESVYPKDGVILTEDGHKLHRAVAIAIFGEDYFRCERIAPIASP
jgi:hypothetical protein